MTGQVCTFTWAGCDARLKTIKAVRFINSLALDEAREYQNHSDSVLRAVASWRCQPWRFGSWESTCLSVAEGGAA